MFDPYHKWLGILPKDQPPSHYRLLGLEPFEGDLEVIEAAAERQMAFVRQYQTGPQGADATRLLNELARARLCLLKPATKTRYDAKLREESFNASPMSFAMDDNEQSSVSRKSPAAGRWPMNRLVVVGSIGVAVLAFAVVLLKPPSGQHFSDATNVELKATAKIAAPPSSQMPSVAAADANTAAPPAVEAAAPEIALSETDTPSSPVEMTSSPAKGEDDVLPVAREEILLDADSKAPRAPVPTPERQSELAKLVSTAYALGQVNSREDLRSAIRKLGEASQDKTLSSDERYAVLTTLVSLSGRDRDTDRLLEAIDVLVNAYDVDPEKEKLRLLLEYLNNSYDWPELKPVAEEAVKLAQAAAKEHRFNDAAAILDQVANMFRRAKGSDNLKKLVSEAREAIRALEGNWREFSTATATLESNPEDIHANLIVGKWHAERSDWQLALPFLVKAGPTNWQKAAELETTHPADPPAQARLADAWYTIGTGEQEARKTAILMHAGEWYQKSLPGLTATLTKQVVATRLAEIEALRAAQQRMTMEENPVSTVARAGEWIDLLKWTEGVNWSDRGFDWNGYLERPPRANEIAFKPADCARFPLAAIVDGNYELEVEFSRVADSAVCIFFPVGIHTMHLEIGRLIGDRDAVRWIEGDQGRMVRSPSQFKAINRNYTVRILSQTENDKSHFSIDINDNKNYFVWTGPSSSLRNVAMDNWRLSMIRHVWVGGMWNSTVFRKARIRMISGTIRRDVITADDRRQELQNGFVRLVGEKPVSSYVGFGEFAVNQFAVKEFSGWLDRPWPLITRNFRFCDDYYVAHAPSRLRSPIPSGAKSFSVIAYNRTSGTSDYRILIDGKPVLSSGVTPLAVMKVDIPPKASTLELVGDSAGPADKDYICWCFPRFHPLAAAKVKDQMLDQREGSLKFSVASSIVGAGSLTRNRPPDEHTVGPIHFQDAQPCEEFLYAHASSAIKYDVPSGMTRFSAIGYNARSYDVKFEVWAGATRVYESPRAGIVAIDVALPPGTDTVTLMVDPMGSSNGDQSLWCYPRLHKK